MDEHLSDRDVMKNIALLLALVGVIATRTTGSAADGDILKRISDTKTVTIGHRDKAVPLSFVDSDGQAKGYSIDICVKIAEAAAKQLKIDKLNIKFLPITQQTRIPLLTAGTVDIICESSTHTFGRSEQVSFLNTTFLTGTKLLVRK